MIKKAEDIQVIRVGDLTILGEYFIIADGTNSTHVKSLVDEGRIPNQTGWKNTNSD